MEIEFRQLFSNVTFYRPSYYMIAFATITIDRNTTIIRQRISFDSCNCIRTLKYSDFIKKIFFLKATQIGYIHLTLIENVLSICNWIKDFLWWTWKFVQKSRIISRLVKPTSTYVVDLFTIIICLVFCFVTILYSLVLRLWLSIKVFW